MALEESAFVDLRALVEALRQPNPIRMRNDLLGAVPELLQPYVTASGELSAVWYEDLRAASSVPGSYAAVTDADVTADRYDALVRWSMTPLFGESSTTVQSLLVNGAQRIIAGGSRRTIDANARADVASTAWARVAQPDACEFCKMLAGRGAVYRSEQSAGMVIGRGVDPAAAFDENGKRKRGGQGKGVKARGERAVGSDDYHDDCNCTAVPTFYRIGEYTDARGKKEKALIPISETPAEVSLAA
jgi:hypothetical protein